MALSVSTIYSITMAKSQAIITFCFFFFFSNLSLLLLFPLPAISHPLCTDSTAPVYVNETLEFCRYSGRTCCGSREDSELQKRFQAMNVSDPNCAGLVKSVLCAKCDQFSAELFTVGSFTRPVPILCNSTVSTDSSKSQAAKDFCSEVWETCQNISISDSPFAPSLQGQAGAPVGSNVTKLTDLWQSKTDFCNAFGGASTGESVCFNGERITLNNTSTESPPPPKGLCLEKIGNGSYLNMVAHPDGSNRAFFSNQPGKIWLATIPEQDSGEAMGIDESNPFVDLTDQVNFDTQFGMMGMAFHPKFAQNGRFFASFNCDRVKWPGCSGRCACNSDVNCDPSKLPKDGGVQPCRYQTVVAEYTANGTSSSPSTAKDANPSEVRRIFTMGLPFSSNHGGQVLFGPDGYLYCMMGDGGGSADPYDFSQNKKSLLGKVLRLDVDAIPSSTDTSEISKLGLWGNYSVPKDNPFREDEELQPEIWALGLRNPWRCSFDSERSSYFICADTGKDTYEEVDIITKGGNYGWRIYEGPYLFSPLTPSGQNMSVDSMNLLFPVLGYNHSDINKNEGSAAIIGGYIYRSDIDPCTYGTYLYADLYAAAMWAGTETPENSGNFTAARIPFRCSPDSPIQCTQAPGTSEPALGYIFSFGEDNRKDIFLLTSTGVYRIVRPSRCQYACSKENVTATTGTQSSGGPSASPPSSASKPSYSGENLFLVLFLLLLVSLGILIV